MNRALRLAAIMRGALCERSPDNQSPETPSPGPLVRLLEGNDDRIARMDSEAIVVPDDDREAANHLHHVLTTHATLPRHIVIEGAGAYRLAWNYHALDDATEIGASGDESADRLRVANGLSDIALSRALVVHGKIAVVTGGAQGIGAAIAERLAQAGAFVVIADLQREGAVAHATAIDRAVGRSCALGVGVDVADERSIRALFEWLVTRLGGLDLLVSNAGIAHPGDLQQLTVDDITTMTSINYLGYFLCVKYAASIMALQNLYSGRYANDIIQINSKSGLRASKRNSIYAGSKFGAIGLTQSFALELIEDNIKVNAICPGNVYDTAMWLHPEHGLFVQFLRTGKAPGARTIEDVRRHYESQVPMTRGCTPDDIVKAIFYCVEQQYETGQALTVSGGQVMLH